MNSLTKAPYDKLALTSVTILLLLAAFTATQVAHAQNTAGVLAKCSTLIKDIFRLSGER